MKETEIIIEPGKRLRHYWRDLWLYRELFYFLSWRDILVRYKQTVIGISWSLIRPLLTMIIFTIIFGKLAKFPSHGIPYPILVFSAILPWQLFASSITDASNSLIQNTNMITKIYFPRLIMPTSSIIVNLVDFLISFSILCVLMVWYQYMPDWRILFIPVFLFMAFMASLGMGLWLSSLNVKYRDFRYIVPFMVQLGLYVSPVGFSSDVIPEKWRMLYSINPMVGVIDGFRWALIGKDIQFYWPGFILSFGIVLLLLYTGFLFFQKMERSFADVI